MTVYLPNDIMLMICNELYQAQDFSTLYNCAVTSRSLAPLALSNLYRMYSQSPNSDDALGGQETARQALQRWSIAWRSIILSTVNSTAFPYYAYLRVLDLRDLHNMLDDEKFANDIQTKFFEGELAKLLVQKEVKTRKGMVERLDIPRVVEAVGDFIVPKASLLVERLSGEFTSQAFLRWLPHLPRLQRLELYDGNALADTKVHEAVRAQCPKFDSLSMFRWHDTESDHFMAGFLNELPSNTLKELTTLSYCGVSTETCLALNRHGKSLKELSINFGSHAVQALTLLEDCTSIEKLSLEISPDYDITAFRRDILPNITAWLSECKSLRRVNLTEFEAAPSILLPLLLDDTVELDELWLAGRTSYYVVKDNRDFHRALRYKRSLKALCLVGDGENVTRDDIDTLVDSVVQLPDLRTLQLRGVADFLGEDAVIRLLSALPLLEDVHVGGYGFSDRVLDTVATLQHLRTISFFAVTSFTCDGLLQFVDKLGAGNEGLQLLVYMADANHPVTEEEQATVRDALYRKVGGRLDYVPMREPGSDFDSSDSD